MEKSEIELINSCRACVADAEWEARRCWHSPCAHPVQTDELYGMDWKSEGEKSGLSLLPSVNLSSPLSLSVTVVLCHFVCLWHCYLSFHLSPSPLCVALFAMPSSPAPAPFIGQCHWAMCAVSVSKTAGRLSSFPCWRMRVQRGSCESYRLGSVKALPVGKLLPPVFLVGSHSECVCLTLKMATHMQHCCSVILRPFSVVPSTCHMFIHHKLFYLKFI